LSLASCGDLASVFTDASLPEKRVFIQFAAWLRASLRANRMPTFSLVLSSWPAPPKPGSTLLLLAIWFGPAIVAALATSWISGRRGGGFGKGAGIGIAVAIVGGLFGCAMPPAMVAAPLIGAAAAVITVLRSE
jgi:hypothetical protein